MGREVDQRTIFVVVALNGDPGHREPMFACPTRSLADACADRLHSEQKMLCAAVRSVRWSDEWTSKKLGHVLLLKDEGFRRSCAAAAAAWNKAGHLLEAHEWDFYDLESWKTTQLGWEVDEVPVYKGPSVAESAELASEEVRK